MARETKRGREEMKGTEQRYGAYKVKISCWTEKKKWWLKKSPLWKHFKRSGASERQSNWCFCLKPKFNCVLYILRGSKMRFCFSWKKDFLLFFKLMKNSRRRYSYEMLFNQTQTPWGFLLVGTGFSSWRGDPSIRRLWPVLLWPKEKRKERDHKQRAMKENGRWSIRTAELQRGAYSMNGIIRLSSLALNDC